MPILSSSKIQSSFTKANFSLPLNFISLCVSLPKDMVPTRLTLRLGRSVEIWSKVILIVVEISQEDDEPSPSASSKTV